ncbi:MAG: hypothetical protein ABR550_08890 [Wenzhouxiangellaceae bacterium]
MKQVLVTLLVAAVVLIVARMKRGQGKPSPHAPGKVAKTRPARIWPRSPQGKIGFALAVITILAAAGVSYQRWEYANQIVTVEVVDTRSGHTTVYHVRRKALGEREFKTVDGRFVSLGASDRMERIER